MKFEPPFEIVGRSMTIQGKDGQRVDGVEHVNFIAVDADGYVSCNVQAMHAIRGGTASPEKKIGTINAKSRTYEIFSSPKAFRVVSTGPEGSRVVPKQITHEFLADVFREISKQPAVRYNEIRRALGTKCKDSLQLTAALAILQQAGCVECVREGKFAYYRKIKEWSLALFQ